MATVAPATTLNAHRARLDETTGNGDTEGRVL